MNSPCQKLEDYLDRLLDDSEQIDFERHVDRCQRCQAEVEFDRKLDEKVVDVWKNISAPDHLRALVQIRPTIKTNDRHQQNSSLSRTLAACLAIAIAILAILSCVLALAPAPNENELTKVQHKINPTQTIQPSPTKQPVATAFANLESNQIFVPLPTQSTNFTILRAYPTFTKNAPTEKSNTGE